MLAKTLKNHLLCSVLPETFIQTLQSFISVRRIEKYMALAEIDPVAPTESGLIAMKSATISWPQDKAPKAASLAATPDGCRFTLSNVNVNFPEGQLSLICGKMGAGKSLLLLGLLGEADCLAGKVICPRSPPNAINSLVGMISPKDWIVRNLVAYCPQTAYLQNASIKVNICFGCPLDEKRYQQVLKACSLLSDLSILEDGDETGELGGANAHY